jgi:hypothetical protein
MLPGIGRKPIHDQPMTPLERKRRHRARRKLERAAAAKAGRLRLYRLELQLQRTLRWMTTVNNKLIAGSLGPLFRGETHLVDAERDELVKAWAGCLMALHGLKLLLEPPKPKRLAGPAPRAKLTHDPKPVAKKQGPASEAPRRHSRSTATVPVE